MGLQKLKVRRNNEGDFLQYDSSLFVITWAEGSDPPAPAGHVFVRRYPQFLRDGRQLEVFKDYDGQQWLGSALRKPPRLS